MRSRSRLPCAATLVRPSKSVLDLEARSVLKRLKDKAFARAVSRDDLRRGTVELGLPIEEHVANVIRFMREQADALGLRGAASTPAAPAPGTSASPKPDS